MAFRTHSFRRPAVTAAFLLVLAVTAAPAAGAQQSQEVVVTAAVDSYLTITLCDLSAEFGSGLTALGTPPTPPEEVVYITPPGTNPGEGVFYLWQPTCPGDLFLTIESNLSYDIFACATENSGTSEDLSVGEGDLRYTINQNAATYAGTDAFATPFQSCEGELTAARSREDHYRAAVWYQLRVDDGDEPGTFLSTTTWSVVAS